MTQAEAQNLLEQEEDTQKGKYLIFTIGAEEYGMEIRYITEIIGIQPITEVPETQAYIRGITNLRGKIIPVIDARLRFRMPVREYDKKTCIIVIDINDLSIGLIVDSVSEVLELRDEDIVPPPDINKGVRRYVKGIGKATSGVKLLLDCERLLSDEEMETLGSIA